jgi:hypothetical protein
MVRNRCGICKREFSSTSGLTQHANAVHQGRTTLSQEAAPRYGQTRSTYSVPRPPEHDEILWNTPITITPITNTNSPTLTVPQVDDVDDVDDIEDIEDIKDNEMEIDDEPRYNLRSQVKRTECDEESMNEASDEESDEEPEEPETGSQLPIIIDDDFDLEDLQGASLDDALDTIEGKYRPERVAEWPNDAYREFMELVIEGNISNKIGDKIIKFFNKYSNLEKSPLPTSSKIGKDYLNQINSPSINFKEKTVATYSEVNFKLHYRPIFRAIQALLQRSKVAENFVHKGGRKFSQDNRNERIFGEPYEGNWWLKTEKDLPPLNHLLSIILYSDATTFDGLGKSSGHPVFLTFGNLPNWVRNSPESKILLGFLPKVQDTGIKPSETFRSFQREVFHKCFNIMLRPLLEKPDALYFGIKGQQMTFAARISFFLSDMLEADEITATYKAARCNMPCHTCMVLMKDLNNMKLVSDDMMPRTHENMQQIIRNGQEKEFSLHSVENAFWKFP